MYTDFFNLKEKPFELNPSSRFLYLGEVHKEALALLAYGVSERKGFTLLTGEVGTGKTTMVHALISRLDENCQYVYLSNPVLSIRDFFSYLAASVFKKKIRSKTKTEFLLEFEEFLKNCLQHQKNFILIIDEAHKLSFELLEEIRLLSNMETADEKLINIFLAGQPELNEKLSSPECRALLQRINTRYHIKPLDPRSTQEYISTRLKMAGYVQDEQKLFSKGVIKAIHLYSEGYPRMINILADNVLLHGYSRGTRKIRPSMVKECYEDLQLDSSLTKSRLPPKSQRTAIREENDPRSSTRWKWAGVLSFLIIVSAFAIIRYGEHILLRLPAFTPWSRQASADIISGERSQAKEKIEEKMQEIHERGIAESLAVSNGETIGMELKGPENITSVKPEEPESSLKNNDSEPWEMTAIVKEGETLIDLASNIYGRSDENILNLLQRYNPGIKDINFIKVGQKIVFPALSGENQGQTFTVHIASYEPFENARNLFLELVEKGYEAYIIPVRSPLQKGNIFQITLGNFETAQEAENYAKEIRSNNVADYAKVIQLEMK